MDICTYVFMQGMFFTSVFVYVYIGLQGLYFNVYIQALCLQTIMYEYSYFVFDSIVSHVHIEKEKKTIQIKKKFYD